MLSLSNLKHPKGARKTGKRLGRGESSGLGKSSGRGGKGQTARSGGNIKPGFEGGQMPLVRRVPKLGFTSRQQVFGKNRYDIVNLSVLETFEAGSTVDPESIWSRGYGRTASRLAGVKILGHGELTKKLHVKAHAVSVSAKQKIEALGGTVELINPHAK